MRTMLGRAGAAEVQIATPRRARPSAVLRYHDFRLLVLGATVEQAGSWAYTVALAVYVYSATHSAAWVAAASVARFLPPLLFGGYAVAIVERFERTRVIVVAHLLGATFMIAMAAVVTFDWPILLALVLAALSAVAGSVPAPATSALVPDLVGEADLAAASALRSTVAPAALVLGSLAGVGLLLLADPSVTFLANSATFLYSAEMVLRISRRSRPVHLTAAQPVGPRRQLRAVLHELRSSPSASVPVGYPVLLGALYGGDTVLFVVVSQLRLGTGPRGFGYLLAGLGAGALTGAVLANRLAAAPRLAVGITAGMAAYSLPTAALAWVHTPALAAVLQVLRGGGSIVVCVLAVAALQRSSSAEVTARVFTGWWALVLAAMSVGAIGAAALLAAFGLRAVLVVLGFGAALLALAGYPRLRRLDRAAAERVRVLAPRVSILAGLDIFAPAPRPVLEQLAGAGTESVLRANRLAVREGAAADALFILLAGDMTVSTRGKARRAQLLRTLQAPAYFGESGLLQRSPHRVSVKTRTPCRLLRIEASDFLDAVATSPLAYLAVPEGAHPPVHRSRAAYRPPVEVPVREPSMSGA